MGEALAYLTDYLAEGGAEATAAGAGATEGVESMAAESSNVAVDTSAVPEAKDKAGEAIQTTPKPKRTTAPKKVQEAVTSVNVPSLTSLPEPGGIGFLLFLILFILFAFKTVGSNGETRLGLLWATIRGQATLGGGVPTVGNITIPPPATASGAGFTTDPNTGIIYNPDWYQ